MDTSRTFQALCTAFQLEIFRCEISFSRKMLQLKRGKPGHVVVLLSTAFLAIIESATSTDTRRLLSGQSRKLFLLFMAQN